MKPRLYEATETTFTSNGIGVLSDAISCMVKEERNGAFELTMKYPISGIHYDEILLKRIILAKANQNMQSQPFRIYRITKPMNGIVEIYAEHISYDLTGIPVSTFTAGTVGEALQGLKDHAVTSCPFTFTTDKQTVATMKVSVPCSIRSQLGGKSGSVLDCYGGEYEFDRYTVKLWNSRGLNRGVTIRYGKNLTSLKQEQNCANVYTGVYPYWKSLSQETDYVKELPEKVVYVQGEFPVQKVLMLDTSSDFEQEPTDAELRARAERYIVNNKIGVPDISLDVSFVQLEQSEEYKGLALLETVNLCDTVTVIFPKLGVNATAKAITVNYNSLLERVESIVLGDAKSKFTSSVLAQEKTVEKLPTEMTSVINDITQTILGAKGGAVRLLDTNDDGVPDTLYIADNPDPSLAVKVWRFNYEGWGASSNGYTGTFSMGATLQDGFYADFITTGRLNTNNVTVGGTGTQLTGTELRIVHSGMTGNRAETVINANGLQMVLNDDVIGGFLRIGTQIVTAMNALYNPLVSEFLCDVGQFEGLSEVVYGLLFKLLGTEYLRMGIGYIEGTVVDTEIVSDIGLAIVAKNDSIGLTSENGDILFTFKDSGGTMRTFKASDVWRVID